MSPPLALACQGRNTAAGGRWALGGPEEPVGTSGVCQDSGAGMAPHPQRCQGLAAQRAELAAVGLAWKPGFTWTDSNASAVQWGHSVWAAQILFCFSSFNGASSTHLHVAVQRLHLSFP